MSAIYLKFGDTKILLDLLMYSTKFMGPKFPHRSGNRKSPHPFHLQTLIAQSLFNSDQKYIFAPHLIHLLLWWPIKIPSNILNDCKLLFCQCDAECQK